MTHYHLFLLIVGFALVGTPVFSQAPYDDRDFTYPRDDPKIEWRYEPAEMIEYEVCNGSDEPVVFYWEKAKFGAAHNCLLRAGTCVSKPDLVSASSGQGSETKAISSGVFNSDFDLNGSDLGDDVPTRLWCAQNKGIECSALDEDWTITSILGLSASQNSCKFEESPFSEGFAQELRISASYDFSRWRIEVGSSLDASLTMFFMNVDESDLLVEDPDFESIQLEDIVADFSNFGDAPAELANADLLGFTVWPEESTYEGYFFVTRKTVDSLRPMLLATYEGQVFAIIGLGAPIQ